MDMYIGFLGTVPQLLVFGRFRDMYNLQCLNQFLWRSLGFGP